MSALLQHCPQLTKVRLVFWLTAQHLLVGKARVAMLLSVKIPVGVTGGTRGKGDKNEFYVRCVDRKHFTRVG